MNKEKEKLLLIYKKGFFANFDSFDEFIEYIKKLEDVRDLKLSKSDEETMLEFLEWLDNIDFDLIIKDIKEDPKATSRTIVADIVILISLILIIIAALYLFMWLYPDTVDRIKREIERLQQLIRDLEEILNSLN